MDVKKKILEIVCRQLDVEADKINLETNIVEDLQADSLALVEIVMAFEEAFDVDIPDKDSERIKTYKDAVDYVSLRLQEQHCHVFHDEESH